ncbi:MAG: MATE family efflux transporter [Clostridia bacterium]|nr:MATE family efflux transporter [Clostridia bacterium]
MAKVRDMTQGNPVGHIIAFAFPMLLGNMFQQMYSLVDTAVVGKICGVESLAAVGSAGWLDWLVLGFVIGLTQGFSILISQRFGAGDLQGMRRAVAMAGYITVAAIVIVTTVSLSLCTTVLRWMNTPIESYDLACSYVQVIFMGIPVTMCYNLFAGMLRALGDSRTPLIAMIIASITNIVLDLLFVAGFDMGVRGAALATVTGQLFSAVFCLIAVLRVPAFRLTREDWRIDPSTLRMLARLGLPIAGQNMIVSIGGVIMQGIVNSFGVVIMAGTSAASKLCGLFEMAGLSIGSSMHTFAGQNLGAGRYDRIRDGVKKAVIIAVSIAILCGILGIIFGRPLLSLFVDMTAETAPQVIDAAYRFFTIICIMLFSLYSLFIFRSTLQGMGDAVFPILSSLLQVFMRTVVTYILSRFLAEKGVYIGDTLAWFSAGIFLMIVYSRRINRLDPRKQ